jgi:thiamine monophosphate synthase
MEKELTDVEKAKQLIEQEKQERAEAFKQELNALCEKYKCSLFVGDIMIKVD